MGPRGSTLGTLVVLVLAAAANEMGSRSTPLAFAGRQDESIVDIDGRHRNPLAPVTAANAIFFVATDCPISNSYAPEIQKICQDYRVRGVSCFLVYEDLGDGSSAGSLNSDIRTHLSEYRYAEIPVLIDRTRIVAKRTKASITPQAVVVDREGRIRYRGRIDNWYVALGKRRRAATEHDLRDALDAVLAGRPVPKVETEALGCYIFDPASLRK